MSDSLNTYPLLHTECFFSNPTNSLQMSYLILFSKIKPTLPTLFWRLACIILTRCFRNLWWRTGKSYPFVCQLSSHDPCTLLKTDRKICLNFNQLHLTKQTPPRIPSLLITIDESEHELRPSTQHFYSKHC